MKIACEGIREQLPLMLYGELTFDQEETLEQHLAECGQCRAAFDRERQLHALLDTAAPVLPAGLLSQSRAGLRAAVEAELRPARPFWATLFEGGSFWKPAAALALLAIGFVSGRVIPAVDRQAEGTPAQVAGMALPTASRLRHIEPDAQGNVRIVYDETREHVVEGRCADQRIQGVLVGAAERDPNPAVRLKALEGLRPYVRQAEVQRALVRVLVADDNPGVRAQVIELLTRQGGAPMIDAQMVGTLQELLRREQDGYVREQCQRALKQVKASEEIF